MKEEEVLKERGLKKLQERLGIKFKNPYLFIQAFTHSSYLNEHPGFGLEDNERLEFLGDAVLELVVSEYLYRHYQESEGLLTKWRAALVNTQSLAETAKELGFDNLLLFSRGEKKNNSRAQKHHLADALEAFIGALYLDRGLKVVKKFISDRILKKLPDIIAQGTFQDAKTVFQERIQQELSLTPRYQVLSESGPDHAKQFRVGVFLNNVLIAQGKGSSKQRAEEKAAARALELKHYPKP